MSPVRIRKFVNLQGNGLATVRIYKVAELLGTTSQEVMALLKRDHGIEVKSASSTIEEVVGRQFVDRLARQRGISLPGGDLFAERPVPSSSKKPMPGARKPEPPKPAQTLGPPRLVKTITRPVHAEPAHDEAAEAEGHDYAQAEPLEAPVEGEMQPATGFEALPSAEGATEPIAAVLHVAEATQPETEPVSVAPER